MNYEEQIIKGVLCWRSTPESDWHSFTGAQLTNIVEELRKQLAAMRDDPNITAYYEKVAAEIRSK